MWFEAFYTLGGGLALFFMGISHLKTGMRSLAGQGLKNALASMARNRVVTVPTAWLAALMASAAGTALAPLTLYSSALVAPAAADLLAPVQVGLLSGMVVTGITNSLTFTSLLLVNFVATDILRFEQTLGVLLGPGSVVALCLTSDACVRRHACPPSGARTRRGGYRLDVHRHPDRLQSDEVRPSYDRGRLRAHMR